MTKDELLETIDEFVAENVEDVELLEEFLNDLEGVCERLDEHLSELIEQEQDDTPEWMQ